MNIHWNTNTKFGRKHASPTHRELSRGSLIIFLLLHFSQLCVKKTNWYAFRHRHHVSPWPLSLWPLTSDWWPFIAGQTGDHWLQRNPWLLLRERTKQQHSRPIRLPSWLLPLNCSDDVINDLQTSVYRSSYSSRDYATLRVGRVGLILTQR